MASVQKKVPENGRRKRKIIEGFTVETRYAETFDVEIKTPSAFPIQVDRDLILRFDLPSSPLLHVDFKNTSIMAQLVVQRVDGTPPEHDEVFTVLSEPLLSMIRRVTVYSMGRSIFSTSSFHWHTLVNRLMQDQAMLDTTAHDMSGYGRDSVPFNICNKPGTQQKYRGDKLKFGAPWTLRGPLPVAPFGTWVQGDQPLIPSVLGLSVEIEFNSSDFCLIRSNKKEESPQPLKLMLNDFKLYPNMKALVEPVSKSHLGKLGIPHHNEMLFSFQALKGSHLASSGQFSMPNHPTRAVVFMSKSSSESQFQNPYEMLGYGVDELKLSVNGREYIQQVDSRLGEYPGAYYHAVRTMAPEHGRFALDRELFPFGYCYLTLNLGRTGNTSLDTIDVSAPRSPCLLSATLKFESPLQENIDVHIFLQSLGKTVIDQATNTIDIQMY